MSTTDGAGSAEVIGSSSRACSACGASGAADLGEVEGYQQGTAFRLHECGTCRTQFVTPPTVPDDIYDVIYERGATLPGYSRYWGYAQAAERLRWPLHYLGCTEEMYWGVEQVLRRRRREGASTRLLEVGSGLGYLTAAVRREGDEAQGIDLSERAVAGARARFGPWYEAGDAADVQQSDRPFDVVVALELIEHLPDPLGFLEIQIRLLPPGGELVVSTPNKSRHPDGARWQTEPAPVHLHWFTEEGFEALVARAGGTMEMLDLSGFAKLQPRAASAPGPGTEPFPPVLDRDLRPFRPQEPEGLPSVRGRVLRYPFTSALGPLLRRARRPGRPAPTGAARANSFVAVVRRPEPS